MIYISISIYICLVCRRNWVALFQFLKFAFWGTFLARKQKNELAMKLKFSTDFLRQTAWRNHPVFYQPVLAPLPAATNGRKVIRNKAN